MKIIKIILRRLRTINPPTVSLPKPFTRYLMPHEKRFFPMKGTYSRKSDEKVLFKRTQHK